MSASSSVWIAIADPNSPANGIPFIDETDLVPTIDVTNFKWMQALQLLYAAGGLKTDYSIAGASGDVTINKAAGVVQFAAGAQTLALTNSKIKDPSSIILCQVLTDDATAKSAVAVPGAGTATIKLNAVSTGIVKVAFFVLRNSEVTT